MMVYPVQNRLKKMITGLVKLQKDNSIKSDIYYAINSEDFRYGSCGGCI